MLTGPTESIGTDATFDHELHLTMSFIRFLLIWQTHFDSHGGIEVPKSTRHNLAWAIGTRRDLSLPPPDVWLTWKGCVCGGEQFPVLCICSPVVGQMRAPPEAILAQENSTGKNAEIHPCLVPLSWIQLNSGTLGNFASLVSNLAMQAPIRLGKP